MGPAISQRNFEVDEDVANLFPGKYVTAKPGTPGKFLVDTGIMVYEGLLNSGIKKENIERSEICTFNENNMHSYRRDKDRSGRMFAVIGIREE
jgi:copper oxidase (laccase) domain-containing protein